MQAILPGQPAAQLHAVDHGYHDDQLIVAYVSGSSLVILDGPQSVIQTLIPTTDSPQPLLAVKIHPITSRIAVASASRAYIYTLREQVKGTLRWVLTRTIRPDQEQGDIHTLSWDSSEEEELILSTGTQLSLYTPRSSTPTWTRALPSPLQTAELSPSASLVASVSVHACLVKIWRRLSFENPQFDYAYLRHPGQVTHVEWRRVADEGDVLFTTCTDGRFRVWKAPSAHGVEILALFAEVDMHAAVQTRVQGQDGDPRRYAFVLDAGLVQWAAEPGQEKVNGQGRHALEYFQEIASRSPDILVVADGSGHMSAWGLESVGCKRRMSEPQPAASVFHVNHSEDVPFDIMGSAKPEHGNARMRAVKLPDTQGEIAILVHHFDGRVTWHQAFVRDLLNPSAARDRIRRVATLTGHTSHIKKIIRTASGNALVSRTDRNSGIVWRRNSKASLQRLSTVELQEHIHRAVLLRNGDFLVCLHHDKVTLWDCRGFYAKEVGRCKYDLKTKPLCLLVLPAAKPGAALTHLATVSVDMTGIAWELSLPHAHCSGEPNGQPDVYMREFARFKLDDMDQAMYVLPVDPAGAALVASDFFDIFAYDVAMSYSAKGTLRTLTARVEQNKKKVDFLTTSTVETGVQNPSLGSATSIRRAALVDESTRRLTIWDTRNGRLDHDETFEEAVHDLDWASTPDKSSILAVGFSRHVVVYSQLRYDYVNDSPAWAQIKVIRLPDAALPSPISDSVWFGDGALIIGTANQLLIAPGTVDAASELAPELRPLLPHQKAASLYQLVGRMNGPLPVFHPQFIAQCVLAGKLDAVRRVLLELLKILKFYTEGDALDPMLGFRVEDFVASEEEDFSLANSRHQVHTYTDDSASTVTEAVAQSLNELLTQKSIPQLTSQEQIALVSIVESVAAVSTHSRSIDVNASRFLLFWRDSLIRSHQSGSGGSSDEKSLSSISWREVVFAYHSTSQDILMNLVLASNHNTITWHLAQQSRMFTWLTSRETLMQYFEDVAKSAYTASNPRDPVVCSLHYLALRKKQVLVGLWRMATWSREQPATMKLLRNDFTDPRWKTAAQKNAFALMGKRRFAYAAAFFLLADDLRSAIGVIANQLEDIDLALAVGRVYGGDECAEVQDLVRDRILATALQRGDRWMATWAFWFLGERGAAVRALVSPLDGLIKNDAGIVPLAAKSFLNDDPALAILYEQLRSKSLQTLRGALQVHSGDESRFVMRTASLLRRMGCDVLALDLVRNWEFLRTEIPKRETVAELPPSPTTVRDPRSLLRRRSSLVVDDLQQRPKVQRGRSAIEPPPSMLDGFGFEEKMPTPQTTKAPPSMLDYFESKPSAPSMLDAFEQPKKVPSMLDGFEEKKSTPSMLDAYEQKAPVRSMLDDFAFETKKPARSMLDAYEEPKKAAPSMLDAYEEPQKQAASMLDAYEEPKKPTASMLDAYEGPKKVPSILDSFADDTSASKPAEKKPTQFTEPSTNSILDSFGF